MTNKEESLNLYHAEPSEVKSLACPLVCVNENFKNQLLMDVQLIKFVKCLQIFFVFKQKICCSFLQMEGVGGHTIGHIIGLNILKLQPIQLLEAVEVKHQVRHILSAIDNNPKLPLPQLH